jgi:hypothetical protein
MTMRLKNPTEVSPAPVVPDPATLTDEAQVNQAVAALDAARAYYSAIVDGAAAAEDALLEAPDVDDHQMLRHSMRVRHARRQLEKLERTEMLLIERGSMVSGDAHARLWVKYATAYREAAEACLPHIEGLFEAYANWARKHAEACTVLGWVGAEPFPRPMPLLDLEKACGLIDAARSPSIMIPMKLDRGPELHAIRFNRFYYEQTPPNRGWLRDQVAGFPAGEAWWLVELGRAAFVGRPPAKPPGYKPPFRWQIEAAQKDE